MYILYSIRSTASCLCHSAVTHPYIFMYMFFFCCWIFTPFSWCPIVVVATILSHRYNSHTGSGETKVESHASSDTQPNLAALLLNTVRIQPGSQPHQCVGGNTVHLATLASAHCPRPATGVADVRWDKDIPTNQALPNPDDTSPIVRRPTDLPVAAGYNRAWARIQSLWWYSWHCSTAPLTTAPPGRHVHILSHSFTLVCIR
jgi:hypothetical protein